MAGRPTKLTPEAHAQIVKALSAGATRLDAARSAGVDYFTFLRWIERGRKASKGIFCEFCEAVESAEANLRITLANHIATAAKDDWRAAEAYLKRRDPAHWGDKLQVGKLSDDELIRLLALAEREGIESGSATAGDSDTEQKK